MVFSSHLFIYYFLPLALVLYYLAPRRLKHLTLTLLSYLFYGWSNPAFMGLMVYSTAVDYLAGLWMTGWLTPGRDSVESLPVGGPRRPGQKAALIFSLVGNLGLLGFFKYFNFGVESWNAILGALGLEGALIETALRVTLPLGISFYTFQSMSYSIDVYRGHARVMRNAIDFTCFVSMFPQLVAGPIIRFSEVDEQLRTRRHTLEKFGRGVAFFCLGTAKKTLLANPCGKVADTVFDAGSALPLDAWYGLVAYAFQIYFDFSAYSDMAIGMGLMLGFVFPKNFDSPYRAVSMTDFWRRWHISLSTWLRDYLYVPLGGNRKGRARTYVNLFLVMLLGGLWHGAAWTFVVWGGLHGLLLAAERWRGKRSLYGAAPRAVRIAATFLLTLLTWVFFRSESLPRAWAYLGDLFGLGGTQEGAALLSGLIYQPYYLITFALAAGVTWLAPQAWDFTRSLPLWKVAVCLGFFWLSLVALASQGYNPFIYFIF